MRKEASMQALMTAAIYFGTFLTIGWVAKRLLDRWMARSNTELGGMHAEAGPNRGKREVFLLGVWRREG
jgi:hypothetical protein